MPDGSNLLEDSSAKVKGICSGNSLIFDYFLINKGEGPSDTGYPMPRAENLYSSPEGHDFTHHSGKHIFRALNWL